MYSGSDLDSLMSALDTLTNSGFLEYDFNVGQKIPYLSVTVSSAQVALFPALSLLPQGQKIVNLYNTSDFSAPVATFISDMQVGVQTAVNGNAALISAIDAQVGNWAAFKATYVALG